MSRIGRGVGVAVALLALLPGGGSGVGCDLFGGGSEGSSDEVAVAVHSVEGTSVREVITFDDGSAVVRLWPTSTTTGALSRLEAALEYDDLEGTLAGVVGEDKRDVIGGLLRELPDALKDRVNAILQDDAFNAFLRDEGILAADGSLASGDVATRLRVLADSDERLAQQFQAIETALAEMEAAASACAAPPPKDLFNTFVDAASRFGTAIVSLRTVVGGAEEIRRILVARHRATQALELLGISTVEERNAARDAIQRVLEQLDEETQESFLEELEKELDDEPDETQGFCESLQTTAPCPGANTYTTCAGSELLTCNCDEPGFDRTTDCWFSCQAIDAGLMGTSPCIQIGGVGDHYCRCQCDTGSDAGHTFCAQRCQAAGFSGGVCNWAAGLAEGHLGCHCAP